MSETLKSTETGTLRISLQMAREWEMWEEAERIWQELKRRERRGE